MSLRELLSRATDSVVYLETYYPHLPPEDHCSPGDVLREIRERVQKALMLKTTDAQCHWLRLCDAELATAEAASESDDGKAVERSLREIRDYLDKARKNFQAVPDFLIIDQTTIRPQN